MLPPPAHPAAVRGKYGEGKVLYYAFDLGAGSPDYGRFASLLKNSLEYVHKPVDAADIRPGQLVPVEIRMKAMGSAIDVRISETYPAELRLYDPEKQIWITDNPWVMPLHLDPDEIKIIRYYVLADIPGTYTLRTEACSEEGGGCNFLKDLVFEITVQE